MTANAGSGAIDPVTLRSTPSDFQIQGGNGNGLATGQDGTATINGTTYPVVLGGRHQGNLVSFDGMVDEVRIYDHPLSESEVLALYQIPEPSTGVLAAVAISLGLFRRRP